MYLSVDCHSSLPYKEMRLTTKRLHAVLEWEKSFGACCGHLDMYLLMFITEIGKGGK